jgi:iron uptake system component EfeO
VARWRGFHVIEKGLFRDRSLRGLAAVGERLVADVGRLQRLAARLSYQPAELANGAQELLDEVAASKITGEEERYSHLDLLDVANNVEGSEQAFAQLEPALRRIDATLSATIDSRFATLDRLVDRFRDARDLSGYVRYTALTVADKRALAAAVKAVQEPLSTVASKVAGQS